MGNTITTNHTNYIKSIEEIAHLSNEQINIENNRSNVVAVVNNHQTIESTATPTATAKTVKEKLLKRVESAAAAESAATNTTTNEQNSFWSFKSLNEPIGWSFSSISFRKRNETVRKSLTLLQKRRSKTKWHRPIKNLIFCSHFQSNKQRRQFSIEKLVAKGAFGVVFKVVTANGVEVNNKIAKSEENLCQSTITVQNLNKQTQTKDKVTKTKYCALKILKKSKIIEEHSVKQIKDEVAIQKLCGHYPFIVQQLDVWQSRHNLFILSEFVPNGELFARIRQFSLDLTRFYVAEIALALEFLHNAGVIYRDAKPENILLSETYHIKLTDFGLSKWLKLGATTKTMCGTFEYMAPEILQGNVYGHAVDWWSLGVIACKMLTKNSPKIATLIMQQHESNEKTQTDADAAAVEQTKTQKTFNELQSINFLPVEVNNLAPAAKDLLERLLIIDPKQRLHSVLSLQRIALYKNFQINLKYLLNIKPVDMFSDSSTLVADEFANEIDKPFHGF